MRPTFDLLVLGDANPDVVLSGGDVIPAFGQAEHLVDDAQLTLGGSGAIMAAGAARLGLRVAIAGVVGEDIFGRFTRDQLEERGVDTRGLLVDPSLRTGLSVILSDRGDRAILTHLGSIASMRADALAPDLLAAARHVHVSSFFLQGALAPGLPGLFTTARAAGATTSVDPNWDPSGTWDGDLLDLLGQTDVFLPNEAEARLIAREHALEDAVRSLAMRGPIVVAKAGADGAVVGSAGGLVRVPAPSVTVLDTTGAGDAFDAGFLAGWLGGRSPEEAARLGNACGALSASALGGIIAQPTLAQADAFLAQEVAAT